MRFLKSLIPEPVLNFIRPVYHGAVALAASFYFGRPSERMVVVGVTGTAGKSTTAAMLSHILNFSGRKTGYITTVNFFDGDTNVLNKHGLSMPGGWLLQHQLSLMLKRGCKIAIVECTSEGLQQNRHLGINFDLVVFTNLSRAHLEAHGSFGNYQKSKGKLFKALSKHPGKTFFPKKMLGVNFDDPMSGYFISFAADKKFGVSFKNIKVGEADKVFLASVLKQSPSIEFVLDGVNFALDVLGEFNIKNAALAAASANMLGVSLADGVKALKNFNGVPGRMESIPNSLGFEVLVDYGCEPTSFKAALEAVSGMPHNRLIHVFGSTGGHRDVQKRFDFGETSAKYADIIIVTNDDIYDSDPEEIAKNIVAGIGRFKLRKPSYEVVLDRRAAIVKALSIAQKNDIVLITGKGSEQFLVLPKNQRIPWDEREVVKEELKKLLI